MAIIFDLDGTLIDTAPAFTNAINKLLATHNKPLINNNTVRPLISEGSLATLSYAFGIEINDPDLKSLQQDFLKLYAANITYKTRLFPGMPEVLSTIEAANIPWAIATNKQHYLTMQLLDKLKLTNRIACIVSGDTLKHAKPHPAPLLYICKKLTIAPQDCVFIGDHQRDIQAGIAAGMPTIAALFGYINDVDTAKTWGATHYVTSPTEILSRINL